MHARCVHDDSPDPAFDRTVSTERPAVSDGARECLLDRVASSFVIAEDPTRHAPERAEPRSIQCLDLGQWNSVGISH
jgi:hypothetical protein